MGEEKTSPDSWERLEGDVQRVVETDSTCAYFGHDGKPCDGCPAFCGTELCEVVAMRDVMSRVKALAGARNG